jgi:hypothetical protein
LFDKRWVIKEVLRNAMDKDKMAKGVSTKSFNEKGSSQKVKTRIRRSGRFIIAR